ncbi:MAG: hypothetical protein KC561_01940 [Myxococcales bacterium]|nr:hypothetical protein [Myxococcales bacterium]
MKSKKLVGLFCAAVLAFAGACSSDPESTPSSDVTGSDATNDQSGGTDVTNDQSTSTDTSADMGEDTTVVQCTDDTVGNVTPDAAADTTPRTDMVVCPETPDYYEYTVEDGTRFTVIVSNANAAGDIDVYVFDAITGDQIGDSATEEDTEEFSIAAIGEDLSLVILVDAWDAEEQDYVGTGTYDITFAIEDVCLEDSECDGSDVCDSSFFFEQPGGICQPEGTPDPCAGNDGNDRYTTATAVTFDEDAVDVTESICEPDVDHFRFSTDEIGSVEITLSYCSNGDSAEGGCDEVDEDLGAADIDVFVYELGDINPVLMLQDFPDDEANEQSEMGSLNFIPAGSYVVRVHSWYLPNDEAEYELNIAFTAETCGSVENGCGTTSPYRGQCSEDGTCVDFEREGTEGGDLGDFCDDFEDCNEIDSEDLVAFCFFAREGTDDTIVDSYCTTTCDGASDCENGYTCEDLPGSDSFDFCEVDN